MEQKTPKLNRSEALDNNDLEQRLEKKLYDVISFKNPFINFKDSKIYLRDKNHKSVKKYKNSDTFTSKQESVDTIVIFGATTASVCLSATAVGLIVFCH